MAPSTAPNITQLLVDWNNGTGTRLGKLGVDPFTLANVLGHSDLRMTADTLTQRIGQSVMPSMRSANTTVTILSR
jgi:hypothetical protein